MRKLTRQEFVKGDALIGNMLYIGWHPTGRNVTCHVTGEWADGQKVWTQVDENGNELYNRQYMLCGKGKKERQWFCLVCVE